MSRLDATADHLALDDHVHEFDAAQQDGHKEDS
jgi:hypothetical protein